MGEPKAFASLSSGLLARKGAARPAMRPQGFGQVGAGLEDLGWNDMGFEAPKPVGPVELDADHDAFGEEIHQPLRSPVAGLTPVGSPVHDQQAEIVEAFAADPDEDYDETAELYEPEPEEIAAPARQPLDLDALAAASESAPTPVVVEVAQAPRVRRSASPRSAPGSKGKSAFTLRLDPERHLKLRLACAVAGRSAQQLVTDALDAWLDAMPEVDSMAARAPAKRARG